MKYGWRNLLSETAVDYCNNTTIHGYKYLVNEKSKSERLLWYIVYIISYIWLCIFILKLIEDYQESPIITTLESAKYHIRNVKFPAIAICDANVISKKQSWKLAAELEQKTNLSAAEIFKKLKWLGRLYDFKIDNSYEVLQLQNILELSDLHRPEQLSEIIEKLTIPCEEMLVKCYLKGKKKKCTKIFALRNSSDGFCCMFNYNKENPLSSDQSTNTLFSHVGIDFGLSVVVRSQPSDYHYTITSMEGLSIKIFNSRDFPDAGSGGMIESFIPLSNEVFLQLSATTVQASDNIKQYSVDTRGCYFENERETMLDDYFYSFSDCLYACKMKSILALCECVPFFTIVLNKEINPSQICTLNDLICLNKYRDKWLNFKPNQQIEELDFEWESAVSCPDCWHTCSYTSYSASTDYAQLINTVSDNMMEGLNLSEHSIVHMYFDTEYSTLYKTDLLNYWFDFICTFGGLCSLFCGFSLISIVEFLYFFTIRYYRLYRENKLVRNFYYE